MSPATIASETPTRTAANVRLRMKPPRASSGASVAFSSMPKDALQDPQRREQRDQRAAALADERQRHARHRDEPDIHADVNEHLEEDESHDADRYEPSEGVIRMTRHSQAPK